jgi:hypothetical protein
MVFGVARGKRHETQGRSMISKSLIAAATEVLSVYEHFIYFNGLSFGFFSGVSLKFDTQEHADRGEQLVREIIAKTVRRRWYQVHADQDVPPGERNVANRVIKPLLEFGEKLAQTLKPGSEELNRLKSLQGRIAKKQAE